MNRLPRNGDALLRMRREGMRPEGVTLISLVGSLPHSNFTLYADPNPTTPTDWTLIAGLEVDLVVDASVPFQTVLRHLTAIAAATPGHLVLSYREGPQIDCGQARLTPQSGNQMVFDWFPMAVGPSHLSAASKVAKRIWSEIGSSLPDRFISALTQAARRKEREAATWPM